MLEDFSGDISRETGSEDGFSTAELLANVALAVVALAFIWTTLIQGDLAPAIVRFIKDKLGVS